MLGCLAGGALLLPVPRADAEVPAAVGDAAARQEVEARLWQALRLADLTEIMQQEALAQADEMAAMLFERGSDAGWRARVAAIHDPARLARMLQAGLAASLAEASAIDASALEFLESPLGRQIIGLEMQARLAIIDQETEDGAIAAYDKARAIDSPRLAQITRLIDGADLMEPAIAAALNEAYAFSRGFADEGGFQIPMTDAEMLADTQAREPEIRALVEEWLPAYMLLAYSPLSDAELARYVEFGTSGPGLALWAVLNGAYERVYSAISREMGEAAALHISGRQL